MRFNEVVEMLPELYRKEEVAIVKNFYRNTKTFFHLSAPQIIYLEEDGSGAKIIAEEFGRAIAPGGCCVIGKYFRVDW